jgi:hypothetical protein
MNKRKRLSIERLLNTGATCFLTRIYYRYKHVVNRKCFGLALFETTIPRILKIGAILIGENFVPIPIDLCGVCRLLVSSRSSHHTVHINSAYKTPEPSGKGE